MFTLVLYGDCHPMTEENNSLNHCSFHCPLRSLLTLIPGSFTAQGYKFGVFKSCFTFFSAPSGTGQQWLPITKTINSITVKLQCCLVVSQCSVLTLKWTRKADGQSPLLYWESGPKGGGYSSTAELGVCWASPSRAGMEHTQLKWGNLLVQHWDHSGISVELPLWHLSSVTVLGNLIRKSHTSKCNNEDNWLRSISLIALRAHSPKEYVLWNDEFGSQTSTLFCKS